MIFNKTDNGNEELRTLTGSYYASNDFEKIKTDILLATEELSKVVGTAVISKANAVYNAITPETDETYRELVQYIQLPIALLATLSMYQRNDVSHEDSGRKVKIDSTNEKLPWEWQLKRDDELHLNSYYKAVDRLITFLDLKNPDEWKNSDQKKVSSSLFIRNAAMFDTQFPINGSGRMYMLLLPFIKEVERRYIKPALGEDYALLLSGDGITDAKKALLEYVYPPIAHLAMSLAIRRMPLGLIPSGIVRNYVSSSQTMSASEPASMEDIRRVSDWLFDDGMTLLEEMKRERNGGTVTFQLLPSNDSRNKYMKV